MGLSVELSKNIFWVGQVDWTVRDFHGYETEWGATYNSYLIRDTKTALIDTVKAPFAKGCLESIREQCDTDLIKYIVVNHAEPDHSSALPEIVKSCRNAEVVCNKKCKEILGKYYDINGWNFLLVEDGDELVLGNYTLQFITTPMVHWPESMFTYVKEPHVLFSMDAFGQHLSTSERFADEIEEHLVFTEAKKYYANILMPFSKQVKATLNKVSGLKLDIVAPSHGLIWRENFSRILSLYEEWADGVNKPKVLVIYDTMWESTAKMAEAILAGASSTDVSVRLLHVRKTSLTDIATELLDASGIAFGSSTLNKGMMPMAAAALTYMRGMMPGGKAGFAFGSTGWSKGGADAVNDYLIDMGWDLTREPLKTKYVPESELLKECFEAGVELGEIAKKLSR